MLSLRGMSRGVAAGGRTVMQSTPHDCSSCVFAVLLSKLTQIETRSYKKNLKFKTKIIYICST